ncbi:SH3 domain-containing protein [Candidatus Nitronereus thalassa]|uniref:SH3 domain-containing protein n=1 Tax=Candidatus Nitronereus thalassa TaxID=3020898 RepID=A0ABU3K761_9BACT|nr:SH3 domain-containing protein [Candidatus Nitronereus thalassa]MDT7042284.1 SH3 domain-containing protein [Candidatus Nitronereus thalassa]
MKPIILKLSFILLAFVLLPSLSQAETMYAKKSGVKVTAEKSPTSKVVGTLGVGDQVQVVKKDGRQYQVKLPNGQSGWVFKFKLSDDKPAGKSSGSSLSGLTGKTTIAARESRSGGSIRGLKETTEQYAQGKNIDPAHRRSVDAMVAFGVSDAELAEFQRAGSVGDYSGGGQ